MTNIIIIITNSKFKNKKKFDFELLTRSRKKKVSLRVINFELVNKSFISIY